MKPALEKFLLIAATLAAIGLFVFVAMWSSIKEKKTQMDDLFNNTNVPSSLYHVPLELSGQEAAQPSYRWHLTADGSAPAFTGAHVATVEMPAAAGHGSSAAVIAATGPAAVNSQA
ncbi:MAG: hypothetical protein K0S39_1472 [Paenibacillus sp.]|nr:hypothetical protein [Paenibacillus sp.]